MERANVEAKIGRFFRVVHLLSSYESYLQHRHEYVAHETYFTASLLLGDTSALMRGCV